MDRSRLWLGSGDSYDSVQELGSCTEEKVETCPATDFCCFKIEEQTCVMCLQPLYIKRVHKYIKVIVLIHKQYFYLKEMTSMQSFFYLFHNYKTCWENPAIFKVLSFPPSSVSTLSSLILILWLQKPEILIRVLCWPPQRYCWFIITFAQSHQSPSFPEFPPKPRLFAASLQPL